MNHPYRVLPDIDGLPRALYTAEQVRQMDSHAINNYGIADEALMERAGLFSFETIREHWPDVRDVTVLCGPGNNGGDGYVIARLAREAGFDVRIFSLGDPEKMTPLTRMNAERCFEAGIHSEPFVKLPDRTGLIVDALLGTGIDRWMSGVWAEAIDAANQHRAPVLSVDIPTGLHADTGTVLNSCIRADVTTTFIGLKQGLFTGEGPEYAGKVLFDSLNVPAALYGTQILSARRIDWKKQQKLLPARRACAHKGSCGHVLVIGGAPGYLGAASLAGEAALRTGSGLVSIATHAAHASQLSIGRPELMCHAMVKPGDLDPLMEKCSVIAIGPGLGRGVWGRVLFNSLRETGNPIVMDADALSLLAEKPENDHKLIITPHPGEAARMLNLHSIDIQNDRFKAAKKLHHRYGGTVVLKGPGTVIHTSDSHPPAVCSDGNPGMATAGMGDVLTGIIASLVGQGLEPAEAAETGVALHAAAADLAAKKDGMRGMIASDLFPYIRQMLG